MPRSRNRYDQIVEEIFKQLYKPGVTEFDFERTDIVRVATELGIKLPKNLGDILYSYRYRVDLPESISSQVNEGYQWIIRAAGRAHYKFVMVAQSTITPSPNMVETKIPDATPGIINKYALNDEQALLARLRYNRLIDIFTGLTCYSLQSHLRTAIPGIGQIETDEMYVGIDKRGVHYVIPVQTKVGKDKVGIVQIEQDLALCASKFPQLICRSIAAQLMANGQIVLFEFETTDHGVGLSNERHYRLVRQEELSSEELEIYKRRSI